MSHPTGCRIKLKVDSRTAAVLDSQSRICSWLYNCLLERANDLQARFIASGGQDAEAARIVYSKYGLRDLIPSLKQQYPFLKTVYNSPLRSTALRLFAVIHEY